ncbi:twin-arginine translocase TatA/TatE family subunit [Microbacterium schleiferi]|jgi:sec-independent protein translocase protein TatA|uniref:twin-arginine translocase TatA/TatE family subunit n=1 Tax=Microbacterium TaxID=33882 RepID=UPI00337C594C
MLRGLETPELLILAALILVVFAGPKLPEIARGVGASLRILRNETRTQDSDSSETVGRQRQKC